MVVRSTGRAIHHTSKLVHRLLALGFGLLLVISCVLAGVAWRLAQGPIDLGRWAKPVREALIDNSGRVRVSFEGAYLAWEGFDKGVDYPIDVRLSRFLITDQAGRRLAAAPSAHLTFSLAGLLLGHIIPRAIEVDHAQIAVTRQAGGRFDLGPDETGGRPAATGSFSLKRFREQLARPASSDHGRSRGLFDQIRRVHFRDASVMFQDRESGLVVSTPDLDLDLIRTRAGSVNGLLRASLSIGGQHAGLTAEADWSPGSELRANMRISPVRPADIDRLPPAVAFLAAVDVPVSLTASLGFGPNFKPRQIQADIHVASGLIRAGQGSMPLRSGDIALSATQDQIVVTKGHFDVAQTPEASPEVVDISGTATSGGDRLQASLTIGLGRIDIAHLPQIWPQGVGGGARPWIVEHVTGGTTTGGTVSLVIEADRALHDVVLTKASGQLNGSNGTFTWMDGIPAVEQADFSLHLVDPDTLDIHMASARQTIPDAPDLLIKDGRMRITGLSVKDQSTVIHTQVVGSVASVLALLRQPRLHLLSDHPIGLKTGGGEAAATLDFQFPLQDKLSIDDVRIKAAAHLTKLRLLDVADGHQLDGGVFDLDIDKDGLALKGQGSLAAIPVTLNGRMDFTPGSAGQVVQKITVTGRPDATQLDAAGLPVTDVLTGPIPLTVVIIERRGGDGSIAINGDLTPATLMIDPLGWRKPPGTTANASAILQMSHDRLTTIDKIAARGDGMRLTGSAEFAGPRIRTLLLDTIRLGRTQGHGTVHFATNHPIAIVLQGERLDLSAKLTEKRSGDTRHARATTPDWTLDARFDHAILANGEGAANILAKATGSGQAIRLLDVVGSLQGSKGFSIKIGTQAGTRHLRVDAKDAGRFLRGVDAVQDMRSGHLTIDGDFGRPFGLQPLTGTARIEDVVVKNSPVLGKLLQAITLYGLVAALSGPGMEFSHIIVPFQYDGVSLKVNDAHASNPSLGLTANGRIALSSGKASIEGTIVPAYFFNSLLGRLPVVGKLFSPEKGGGVFAARFALNGRIDDPTISINPVSALTPGFLRGIFGIFDHVPPANGGATAENR